MREVLDLESRRRIFELLTEYPGLHLRELERRLGMDVRGLQYHLEFLESHGALSSLREGGYLRYYPREWDQSQFREQFGPAEKRILAVLRQPRPLQLILLLLEHGDISGPMLQGEMGLGGAALTYHLRKLLRLHVVDVRTVGRVKHYQLKDPESILQLIIRYRPPPDLIEDFLDLWERVGL
ncbi:MAG: winged helix-turn-helix transcriptional regulator [Thermoplasmata archaeon]